MESQLGFTDPMRYATREEEEEAKVLPVCGNGQMHQKLTDTFHFGIFSPGPTTPKVKGRCFFHHSPWSFPSTFAQNKKKETEECLIPTKCRGLLWLPSQTHMPGIFVLLHECDLHVMCICLIPG